jgi:hypothetical protein
MIAQEQQPLQQFLEHLSLDVPAKSSDFESEVICYPNQAIGVDNNQNPIVVNNPGVRVFFRPVGGFTLDALLGIMDSRLKRSRHLRGKGIALSILGMYLILRGNRTDVDYFYEMMENIITTDATFYYVFPKFDNRIAINFTSFSLGNYKFGKLNTYQIGKNSRMAGSDYFDRYEKELRNRLAIEKRFEEVTLINWWKYREMRKTELFLISKNKILFEELSENYFDQLSLALFEVFLKEIEEEQYLTASLGNYYINQKDLLLFPYIDRVVIFHDVDGKQENGFVKPLKTAGYLFDLGAIDSSLPATKEQLKNQFDFVEFSDCEVHQTLKSFARFVAKAKQYKWSGQLDEAFLHFIIPLDMVFGKKGLSVDSVSKRVAALTYINMTVSFKEQVRKIKDLYDERSAYVHKGKSPNVKMLADAEAICHECILCLLRLQKDKNRRNGFLTEKWISSIDLIIAILETDSEPSNELLIKCGVAS